MDTAMSRERSLPWKWIFRVVRWSTYLVGLVTVLLMLHKAPTPVVETNPQAAARAEQKLDQVQQAVASGQAATLRMDQTELNSYLLSHLDIPSNPAPVTPVTGGAQSSRETSGSNAVPAASGSNEGSVIAAPAPGGTPEEQIEQAQSAVKDVKVELIGDRARAFVVFNFHGKDLTLQLEGRLGAEDGYLRFDPVSGQIGSLPIPQSTLETAVRRLMESPENREKLKLPDGMSSLKIENGEVVASYK